MMMWCGVLWCVMYAMSLSLILCPHLVRVCSERRGDITCVPVCLCLCLCLCPYLLSSVLTLCGFVVYDGSVGSEPRDSIEGGTHVQGRGSLGTVGLKHHGSVVFCYLREKRREERGGGDI